MRYLLAVVSVIFFCTCVESVTHLKHAVGCENEIIKLTCDNGKVMNILEANYGRTTRSTCMNGQIGNVTCYNHDSLSIVADLCEGQPHCEIHSANNVFGDPCPGIFKYLFILYECQTVSEFQTAFSCEHKAVQLDCKAGKLIHVLDANYGRKSRITCAEGSILATNCQSRNSVEIVSRLCTNKKTCNIYASNDVFGDPCEGTYKYLTVKYKCVAEPECGSAPDALTEPGYTCSNGETINPSLVCDGFRDCPAGDDEIICDYDTKYACEGNKLQIKCRQDQTIQIVNGNYGRLTKSICPTGKNIRSLNCKSENAVHILKNSCNGQRKCVINAANKVFGDPCVNTVKYLEVHYECVREADAQHNINPRSV